MKNSSATLEPQIATIFGEAIAFDSPAERAAYLDSRCADNAALRAEVEHLLENHRQMGGFMEKPLFRVMLPDTEGGQIERLGAQIGPYKLLQQIGE
ncbi:MAG: hypothetical protein SFX18_09575 [Pirellulales bacterium]|nr:hypothetical protein [Pirellulales bacterium]